MTANKKFIVVLLKWIGLLLYLLLILGFVRRERMNTSCNQIRCNIDKAHEFVDTTDVFTLLRNDSIFPLNKSIKQLNLLQIENCIEAHEAIKNAEVYLDMDGLLHLDVLQRNPVLRIITQTNMHYYVDEELGLMSVGYEYTADVPVLSGYLPDTLVQAFRQENDTLKYSDLDFNMQEIIKFADFIYHDELWRDLFVQIYINKNHEFELVPRVGNQIIILGKLENYEYKMKKLKAMYMDAFPKYGWKKYREINLKYSNQVVCSK
jgi:cell division protein FtsQ